MSNTRKNFLTIREFQTLDDEYKIHKPVLILDETPTRRNNYIIKDNLIRTLFTLSQKEVFQKEQLNIQSTLI